MQLIKLLIISFCLTYILEICFALVWGIRDSQRLLVVGAVNLLTNPALNLIRWSLSLAAPGTVTALTWLLEIFVVLIEWQCYRKWTPSLRRPFVFSLLANAFSYCAGLIIYPML